MGTVRDIGPRTIDGCNHCSMAGAILDARRFAFLLASCLLVEPSNRSLSPPLVARGENLQQKKCPTRRQDCFGQRPTDSSGPGQYRLLWKTIAGDGDRAIGSRLVFGTAAAGVTHPAAIGNRVVCSADPSFGFACSRKRLGRLCRWMQLAPRLPSDPAALRPGSATLSLGKPDS